MRWLLRRCGKAATLPAMARPFVLLLTLLALLAPHPTLAESPHHGIAMHGDLALPPDFGPFERILVHGRLAEVPERLVALLGEGGQMVLARDASEAPAQQRIVRLTRDPNGDVAETILGPCRLQSIVPGIAARL